jgi:hypothetical protein
MDSSETSFGIGAFCLKAWSRSSFTLGIGSGVPCCICLVLSSIASLGLQTRNGEKQGYNIYLLSPPSFRSVVALVRNRGWLRTVNRPEAAALVGPPSRSLGASC